MVGVFVTTDNDLKYPQNLAVRRLGIVMRLTISWPGIQANLPGVVAAIGWAQPGSDSEVSVPSVA